MGGEGKGKAGRAGKEGRGRKVGGERRERKGGESLAYSHCLGPRKT